MTADGRYAIYFAPPPGSAFAAFGNRWIGRDPLTGRAVDQPEVAGVDMAALTAFPRTYGFHATLKAPFILADGARVEDLREAIGCFAAREAVVTTAPLQLDTGFGFLALVPSEPAPALGDLAQAVVERFEAFRAPLTAADRARRLAGSRLSDRQVANLDRWGYPFVDADFHFHMTLSGRLADQAPGSEVLARIVEAARTAQGALVDAPFTLDALALFHQPDQGAPFRLLERFPLDRAP